MLNIVLDKDVIGIEEKQVALGTADCTLYLAMQQKKSFECFA